MVYNLVQYLTEQFPSLSFVAEAFNASSPDDCIRVTDTGGTVDHNTGRPDITIQISSRSKDNSVAKSNIDLVFEKLKNRAGLVLSEATVGSVTYPALKTYRIVPVQRFGYMGTTSENHHLYTFNSIVTLDYS